MVRARLTISTLAMAALLVAGTAQAADYSQPLPPQPIYIQPQPVIEEVASGWYLRGDIGFSNQRVRSLFNGDAYSGYVSVENTNKSFDAAPFFGVGIGYNFNDWLRFDVTGEYRANANFHGLDIGAFPAGSPYGTGFAPDRYTASKSEWTFLFNGYVDLGTWYNVTPFVGAGIGMSRNTISSFRDTCVTVLVCSGGSVAFGDTASKWNLAWALHAGLSYKVTRNFTVELAYRYVNLGDAQSGDLTTYLGGNAIYNPMEFHNLTSHDVKLGLRFNLDGLSEYARPAPYYSQPQIYTPPPVYAPPVYAPPPPLRSRG